MRHGFTLIEMMIAMAIAAIVMATAVAGINSVTNANLHSGAVHLTGEFKFNYDRAIMRGRTQRLALDIDKNVYWSEYTESPFALAKERDDGQRVDEGDADEPRSGDEGRARSSRRGGRRPGAPAPSSSSGSSSGSPSDDKEGVRKILEAGQGGDFKPDTEADAAKPTPLPNGVHIARVYAGHQVEPFSAGVAYIYFFPGGWTEPAFVELVDDDQDVVSLELSPLTGRVRTHDKAIEAPKNRRDDDGREEGDE